MTILTSFTSATYKAQIRSSAETGFKQLHVGSCTESDRAAARNLVRKYYGEAAVETVRQVKDAAEIAALVGDFFKSPSRKQVFDVWTFDMQAKSKKPEKAGPTESPLVKRARELREAKANPPATATPTEVLAPRQVILSDASKALQRLRKICATHEEKFLAATLGPRLQIGLQCLKAYQVFCIKDPGKKGQGRKPKNHVTRDVISTGGFEGWLAAECQWLKKPTAYKYMTAIRGLSLDHTATEKQVAAALKLLLRKGPVSIKLLCDMSLDKFGPQEEIKEPEQQEFDFLRTSLSHFREETEILCRLKSKLDCYPDFKRAATARLYSALYELTGTHWQPSDEADALAHIDPDSITI